MERILIVEDDPSILIGMEDNLRLEGYDVRQETDGNAGLAAATGEHFDLIILDIMLPGLNGFDICRRIRERGLWTPILILTARSHEADKILGLELGADDYVTKPFSPREILARVRALLRRAQPHPAASGIAFGDVAIDFARCEASKGGRSIHLSSLEYTILHLLTSRAGEVLSRNDILDAVWGDSVCVSPRTVDTHIGHLRQKIEDEPTNPAHLLGVRGVGYKFRF